MSTVLDLPPLTLVHVQQHPLSPPVVEMPPFDDAGAFLGLPPIGAPMDALHTPHVAEATNPGTFNPLTQNMARHVSVDQTMSVTGKSGPISNSDGQMQLKDSASAVGQKGVTVTAGHVPVFNSDGNVQLPNVTPLDHTTWSEQRPGGLPLEAKPDSQNMAKLMRTYADPLPIATNVRAGDSKPGKLPVSHIIK